MWWYFFVTPVLGARQDVADISIACKIFGTRVLSTS